MKPIVMTAVIGCLACAIGSGNAEGASVGTKALTLANAPRSCINVSSEYVDFWLLSARIPRDDTFWTDTSAVGARVDVNLKGAVGQSSFPAAASISLQDISGASVIRASLSLHVMSRTDLWDSVSTASATHVTSISTPVTFVRLTGSSDFVKVTQALVNFTSNAGSVVPEAAALEPGAKLVGQLFNTLNTAFSPSGSDESVPNFQLSFGAGLRDTGCQAVELHQGVGVMIADYAPGGPGIIQTKDASKYCFYKHGDDSDPDIDFLQNPAPGANCPANEPAGTQTLNNPQFIWLAYGTCKTTSGCSTGSSSFFHPTAAALSQTPAFANSLKAILRTQNTAEVANIQTALRNGNVNAIGSHTPAASAVSALALCKSVGISATRCADSHFATVP